MSYWTNKKVNKTKNYVLNGKKRNVDNDSSKENIFGLTRSVANRDDASEYYFYVDPRFVDSFPMDKLSKRLRGGQYETETYYDCLPCSCKEIVGDNQLSCHKTAEQATSQHSRIDDISGDIENAKEFKKVLKQMALSSNALYRTFRQAYDKNKKPNRKANETFDDGKYCLKCGGEKSCENICGETVCIDDTTNPFNVVNVVLPNNNKTSCSKCEVKEEKSSTSKSTQHNSSCYLNATKQKSSNNLLPQNVSRVMKCDSSQQLNPSFKDLNFCEKCAILRGELPLYKNIRTATAAKSQQKLMDTSCQTCCETVECCNKPIKIFQEDLNQLPIFITVPLNVQIDAEGGRAHIIDSEIVIETSADRNEQKHYCGPSTANAPIEQDRNIEQVNSNALHSSTEKLVGTGDNENSINVSAPIRTVANRDDFYPCIPGFKGTDGNESSINVSAPIRTVANRDDFYPCIPGFKGTEGNGSSINVSAPIRTEANSDDFYPCIPGFKGTEGNESSVQKPTTSTRLEPKKDVGKGKVKGKEQTSKPLTNLELLKMKTERLRAELVQEIKTTLEHKATTHEVDLPANVRRKNEINASYVRFSLPDGHQARNMEQEPQTPISSNVISSATQTSIPEGVQNNISTALPNSRYKRNELRTQIQKQLQELLQPYKFILQEVYDTEERNEILLDFQKIFHPEVSNMLAEEIRLAEAVQGIRYILEPEQPQNSTDEGLQLSESAIDLLEDIRRILNLKPKRGDKSKHKKYHKEAKETILEGLQTILKPRKQQTLQVSQEIRDIVLHDLNVMLKTCQSKTLPTQQSTQESKQELKQESKQESKQELKQESKQVSKQVPNQESKQELEQERSIQKFAEIREGLLADLRLMLDTTSDTVQGHSRPSTSLSPEVQQQTEPQQINEIRDGLLAELRRLLDASPHLRAENAVQQEHTSQGNTKPTFSNISSRDSLRDNKKQHQ